MKTLDQTPVDLEVGVYELLEVYRTNFKYELYRHSVFDVVWHFISESSPVPDTSKTRFGLIINTLTSVFDKRFKVDSLNIVPISGGTVTLRSPMYVVYV